MEMMDDAGSESAPDRSHTLDVGNVGHEGHDHAMGEHCQEVLASLYTFLDSELTVEVREQIRIHLDECLPCFEAFDFEAELRTVIHQRCRDSVPEDLRLRIASLLEGEPPVY